MDLQNIYNRGALPLLPTLPSPSPPLAAAVQNAIALREHSLFAHGMAERSDTDLMVIALHLLLYDNEGEDETRKEDLLNFSGFPPNTDLTQKVNELVQEKYWTTTQLRATLKLFGLAVRGTREEMSTRLVRYLSHPYDVHKIGTVVIPTTTMFEEATVTQGMPFVGDVHSSLAPIAPVAKVPRTSPSSVLQSEGNEQHKVESIHELLGQAHQLLQHVAVKTRHIMEDQTLMTADELQHCHLLIRDMLAITNDLDSLVTNQELTQSTTAAMIYNAPSSNHSEE